MRDLIAILLIVMLMGLTLKITKLETIVKGIQNIVSEIHRESK